MPERKPEIEQREYQGLVYYRHTKDRQDPRGTLSFFDAAGENLLRKIPGFPPIKRVYRLREGVERLFHKRPFLAEEKLDGYNVRIFCRNHRLWAASRGGFICPFTTEWAELWSEDEGLGAFFRDYPEHTLCGEVLGDNPYNKQRDPFLPAGAHIFVFDILDPQGSFLPPEDRYALIDRYGLPGVPRLGTFRLSELDGLYRLVRDLNEREREGVVLKSQDSQRALKFVTPTTDLSDIRDALQVGFDLPSGYFFNRYLRACLFIKELGLEKREYAERIGRAFLEGSPSPEGFEESSESYTIYVRRRSTWDELRRLLATQVLIRTDSLEPTSLNGREMLRVVFRRIYQKSSHRYRRILKGSLHQD